MYIAKLSHENFSLAFSEFNSIMRAEEIDYRIELKLDEFIVFRSNNINLLLKRAALLTELGELIDIINVDNEINHIMKILKDVLDKENTCISVDCVKGFGKNIAKEVIKSIPQKRICTRKKIDEGFEVVKISLALNIAFVYRLMYRRRRWMYIDREPQHRPCYKPGTMKPLLARVFVNLSKVSVLRREIVLDPFCGVGGFVVEACSMGLRAICSDIDESMVKGAQINLTNYECNELVDIIRMDAAFEALLSSSVHGIATDPPYGIQSTPRGRESLKDLLKMFIENASNILKSKRYMVFAAPIEISKTIENILIDRRFKITEKHLDMVHGSLTRSIYVARKID